MSFIRHFLVTHLENGLAFYFLLMIVLTWNYIFLPETIPFYLFDFINPTGAISLPLLMLLNLSFIFLLSLMFIYPNKQVVKSYRFTDEKYEKRMFLICQLISFTMVIFIRQIFETIVSILNIS